MKKIAFLMLAALMVLACFSCAQPAEDIYKKSEGVMTYAQFEAASLESPVTVEAYIQAKQGWWTDDQGVSKASFYTQDGEGGYFIYNLPCSEADYNKMIVGTKIRVKGYKAEWSGEVEIIDGSFEILEGNYVAEPLDVTAKLASEDLIKNQNMFVSFKGMTVAASKDADGNDVAFLYSWDGSGSEGDDLYFNVSVDGKTYNFVVESYLCGTDSDVYKAVKNLKIGDKVDLEGFLYWYNGANPHITSVKAAA